jgi:membrane protein
VLEQSATPALVQKEPERGEPASHGRPATGLSGNSARRWKDILLSVYREISAGRILANAAGVSFYALLAVFPGIAALVSIYGLFADPGTIASHVDAISGIAPGGAIDVLRDQLTRIAAQGRTTLGIGFISGLLISLWSANSGTKALFDALNAVYDETETRSFIRLNATTLAFTLATILFLLVALACVIVLPVALDHIPRPSQSAPVLKILRWPILLVLIAAALALIYRFGPNRANAKCQWISCGSIFATVVWLAASVLFSWYAANFGSFNKTYGSLGAVIGFMIWIWLSTIVVLVGGKLNAEIERRPAQPPYRPDGGDPFRDGPSGPGPELINAG